MSAIPHALDREVASGAGRRDDCRVMRMSSSVLARAARFAIFGGLLVCCGLAQSDPVRLFWAGEIEQDAADARIRVRSGLVQIEIAPGFVVSAGAGSEFHLGQESPENTRTRDIAVLAGEIRLVATKGGALYVLRPGRYRWQPLAEEPVVALPSIGLESGSGRSLDFTERQNVRIADSAMLRQGRLLQVDTTDFVRGILSLFRR